MQCLFAIVSQLQLLFFLLITYPFLSRFFLPLSGLGSLCVISGSCKARTACSGFLLTFALGAALFIMGWSVWVIVLAVCRSLNWSFDIHFIFLDLLDHPLHLPHLLLSGHHAIVTQRVIFKLLSDSLSIIRITK